MPDDRQPLTLYRHAAWDTPWRVNATRSPGRYNRPGDLVQYWCTHPSGPAAEMLRGAGATDPADVQLRLWAARCELAGLVEVTFDNAREHQIAPEALVGEEYAPTLELAQRLRADGAEGLIVPSAALPDTRNVALLGPSVIFPYLYAPIDPEQVPTAHIADAPPPAEVVEEVRHRGVGHAALTSWRASGSTPVYVDPPVAS